jgi:hypothetical protein
LIEVFTLALVFFSFFLSFSHLSLGELAKADDPAIVLNFYSFSAFLKKHTETTLAVAI